MMNDSSLAASATMALQSGNLWLALGAALVGGFLTALSPCVYPLIPITVTVFGARDTGSKAQSFSLALTYTLGMVLLYAILGTAFASAGKVFGTLLANPFVVVGFALFCALMAASMLGAFEFSIPVSWQTRLSTIGGRGYRGAFLMGLISGLVAAPCTGPVLSVLLAFIASTQNLTFGFALMLAFGTGLGLPFLLIATFSSSLKKLPRSGAWMDAVKAILGIAMIALSFYYLQFVLPIAPKLAIWLPWALIIFGIAVGGIHLSVHGTAWHVRSRKIGGALITGVGVFFAFFAIQKTAELKWEHDLDKGLALAAAENKPVMIDFYADWCGACIELDKHTFSQPEVKEALGGFITIKVDGTDETDQITAIYEKYGVKGLPTVLFIGRDQQVLSSPRVTGFMPKAEFLPLLAQVK